MSSVINSSSDYWKGSFSNLGINLCSCVRPENLEDEIGQSAQINILLNKEPIDESKNTHVDKNQIENFTQNIILNEINIETNKISSNYVVETIINEINTNNIEDNLQDNPPDFYSMTNNKRNWSTDEDKILLENISSSRNWKKLSTILKSKSPQQCAYRYNKLTKNLENTSKWTRNDDILLMEQIENFGENWNIISQKFIGKSSEEIQERYEKKLNPNLKRCKFEHDEDVKILQLHEKFGNKWNEIAKYFKDRNAAMIKNRFYSCLIKKIKLSIRPNLNSNSNYDLKNENATSNTMEKFSKEENKYENFNNIEEDSNTCARLNNAFHNMNFEQNSVGMPDCYLNTIIDNEFLEISSRRNSQISDDCMWISPQRSKIGNTISRYSNEMIIDDTEANFIPTEIIQLQTNSPKKNDNEQITFNNQSNFNEHYKNAFAVKIKPSFEEEEKLEQFKQKVDKGENETEANNNFTNRTIDNGSLMKQYQMLENVFNKVQEVSNYNINSADTNIIQISNKLDEKRDNLSQHLKQLKYEYLNNLNNLDNAQNFSDKTKDSLIKQIEVLMELIQTTKLKIGLIEQYNKSNDVVES